MVKLLTTTATVLALMPVIWVSSALWATALSAKLITEELRRRLPRERMSCCRSKSRL
jgi:hypothetical protein